MSRCSKVSTTRFPPASLTRATGMGMSGACACVRRKFSASARGSGAEKRSRSSFGATTRALSTRTSAARAAPGGEQQRGERLPSAARAA